MRDNKIYKEIGGKYVTDIVFTKNHNKIRLAKKDLRTAKAPKKIPMAAPQPKPAVSRGWEILSY